MATSFLLWIALSLPALAIEKKVPPNQDGGITTPYVEAESFAHKGGWQVDQQFTHSMGSPYLLAHGLGRPVENARTTVSFSRPGLYRLWVRTKNWVPGDWPAPGRFQVLIDGKPVKAVFGTQPGWGWQDGGTVEITQNRISLELLDLTGFDGRCDALYFCPDGKDAPPDDPETLRPWRNALLGMPEQPPSAGTFDLVVVGGGIAGCAAAIAAAGQCLEVALIHDRPVLGGNASSEVRVHTLGIYGKGEGILKGLDTRHWPNGSVAAIADTEKRQDTLDEVARVHQFLGWRAYGVNQQGSCIESVEAKHIETGETKLFAAPIFIDCTGDGWIGYWAGADYRYGREAAANHDEAWAEHGERWSPQAGDNLTMGASLLWNSERGKTPSPFPEVPWALAVAGEHKATAGEWDWEYASRDQHQIEDAEAIRDHLLRAIYGSFYNAKQEEKHADRVLKWVGFIAGKRESRRLMGDYLYTQEDALSRRDFEDAVVEEEREIDLHYQIDEGGFRSRAIFRSTGGTYRIPYRCFYSRNIDNLLMAGRCFSCSHIGLGGPRVMRTTGQMGIATGYAASLCRKYGTGPRGIYENHLHELRRLIGYDTGNMNHE